MYRTKEGNTNSKSTPNKTPFNIIVEAYNTRKTEKPTGKPNKPPEKPSGKEPLVAKMPSETMEVEGPG